MAKTYINALSAKEVSLAIEHLLVAPSTVTTPTVGRIDLTNAPSGVPSGFEYLGGVVEDSPQVTITRDKYQLQTGIPAVLQFEAVTALSGQFSIAFYSNSNLKVEHVLGGASVHHTFSSSIALDATTPVDTTDYKTVNLGSGATPPAVGDYVIVTNLADPSTSHNEAKVASVSGTVVTLEDALPIASEVSGTPVMYVISNTQVSFGTSKNPKFYLIGVADFIDGSQVQHHFPLAAPTGEFTENIQPGQAPVVAGTWNLFGYVAKEAGMPWNGELILGKRIYIPKNA